MQEIIDIIVNFAREFGYLGIFIMMFLESTFFPFPSEVAMIPAGYLASQGEMSLILAILIGTMGSLSGALFNYYLAKRYGRKGVLKFGQYFFFTEEKLQKMERFFVEHGSFSTFVARLIPGVRQFVSLPAGLSAMNIKKFMLHTTLGAGIWVIVLALLGYFIGGNEALIKAYMHEIVLGTLFLIVVGTMVYVYRYKRAKKI